MNEAAIDLNPYSCDLVNRGSIHQHLRYVNEEDVETGGCDEEGAEVHCMKKECRAAVDHAEFEKGSLVSVIRSCSFDAVMIGSASVGWSQYQVILF